VQSAKQTIPEDVPEARGKYVIMLCLVYADHGPHGGCWVMRQSHSGVIIFVNWVPIMWYLKQETDEHGRVKYVWI
jgi:hypothetical protein